MYAGTFDPRRCALTRSLPGATTRGARRPRLKRREIEVTTDADTPSSGASAHDQIHTPPRVIDVSRNRGGWGIVGGAWTRQMLPILQTRYRIQLRSILIGTQEKCRWELDSVSSPSRALTSARMKPGVSWREMHPLPGEEGSNFTAKSVLKVTSP